MAARAVTAGIIALIAAAAVFAGFQLRLRPIPQLPSAHTAAAHPAATRTAPAGPLPQFKAGSYAGVRPKMIDFSADGTNVITGIRWSQWTMVKAVGTGTRYLDNCQPNCAQGTTTKVSETITLSAPEGGFYTVIVTSYAGHIGEYTGAGIWALTAS